MNFGQVVGEPLGLLRGQSGFLRPDTFFAGAVHAEAGVGESGVGQREVGVFVDGLLEQGNGGPNSIDVVTIAQRVPSLQVEIVGLYVLGRVGADACLLFVGGLEFECSSHRAV